MFDSYGYDALYIFHNEARSSTQGGDTKARLGICGAHRPGDIYYIYTWVSDKIRYDQSSIERVVGLPLLQTDRGPPYFRMSLRHVPLFVRNSYMDGMMMVYDDDDDDDDDDDGGIWWWWWYMMMMVVYDDDDDEEEEEEDRVLWRTEIAWNIRQLVSTCNMKNYAICRIAF